MRLRSLSLDELVIDDEGSLAHVALYARLKASLRRSSHRFQVPADGATMSWDRALFLNLTFWTERDGGDVLCDKHIPADVVAHVSWHEIVGRQLGLAAAPSSGPPSAAALFFAESIASAFDLYLVGRLLPNAPESDFITTQVPQLAACAEEAGMSHAFEALMQEVVRDPERAFEDMRALLFEAANALHPCRDPIEAVAALERFEGHRFEPLLHHFQLSNWILYARAHTIGASPATDAVVAGLHETLCRAPVALDWLADNWLWTTT